jgi:hypothetical protein
MVKRQRLAICWSGYQPRRKRRRLAISDWQIVGVAISHDEKAATTETAANGD